jgi:predicted TPR repeat methyltransferase
MEPFATSGDLLADRRYRFGRDLAGRGDFSAAADLFAQAVEAAPRFAPAFFALGEARRRLGDVAAAVAAFREALRIDPQDHCGAALHLARLGERDAGEAMSAAYVRTLFDQYAPTFDAALDRLAYRAPLELRQAVERWWGNAGRFAPCGEALDIGCGTGLAGAAFRPLASRLVGIDLSPAMVAAARAKAIYDRLETGDLVTLLAAEHARGAVYDLVIAADVFVYLPDLTPAAAAVARVLGPGSAFAFTVETHQGGVVELGQALRYRHGKDHVRAAVGAAGLRLVELSPMTTRIEAQNEVPGLLALAIPTDGEGGRDPLMAPAAPVPRPA